MARKKSKKILRVSRRTAGSCIFCTSKREPSYKEHDKLVGFMTDRGKVLGGARSGVCSKHQRRLVVQIKRARELALLPFADRV